MVTRRLRLVGDADARAERLPGVMHDIGARARVGDHTYGLSSVDRRQVPVEAWLRHLITATDVPAPSGPSGFWRTAFDQAVRDQAVREQAVRDALPH